MLIWLIGLYATVRPLSLEVAVSGGSTEDLLPEAVVGVRLADVPMVGWGPIALKDPETTELLAAPRFDALLDIDVTLADTAGVTAGAIRLETEPAAGPEVIS